MAATCPFCYFVLSKNRIIRTSNSRRYVEFSYYRKGFSNSNKQFSFGIWNLFFYTFDFSVKDYEVGPAYWLILTLDPSLFAWEIAQYFVPRAPSWTSFIPPQQKIKKNNAGSSGTEQRMSSQEHPLIREWWILRIHNGSCPSSRTLLSTTSFQTKFYHNIPQILNRYAIDSIMESWIVIGLFGTYKANIIYESPLLSTITHYIKLYLFMKYLKN